MRPAPPDKPVDSPHRYSFLDLYRGIVVLLMLEGHLVRELLAPSAQASAAFRWHEAFHGMTAPGFMFGAGFAFAIATQRRSDQLRRLGRPFARRVWRALTLVLIGYALHLPYFSLSKTLNAATPQQWAEFLQFDVLQLIGVGLITLRVLYLLLPTERAFLIATGTLSVAVAFATPWAWNPATTDSMPLWLSQAMAGTHGSPFPLFPYVGFLLAGAVVAWSFLRSARADQERRFMLGMFGVGAVLTAGGTFLHDHLPGVVGDTEFWTTSASYFWLRLGLLFAGLAGLWFLENAVAGTARERVWMPGWLTTLGVESLFVYIAHLLVLYGWVLNADVSMRPMWSGRLTPIEAGALVAGLCVVMVFAASAWRHLKKHHAPLMQVVWWWMGLGFVGEFLLRSW